MEDQQSAIDGEVRTVRPQEQSKRAPLRIDRPALPDACIYTGPHVGQRTVNSNSNVSGIDDRSSSMRVGHAIDERGASRRPAQSRQVSAHALHSLVVAVKNWEKRLDVAIREEPQTRHAIRAAQDTALVQGDLPLGAIASRLRTRYITKGVHITRCDGFAETIRFPTATHRATTRHLKAEQRTDSDEGIDSSFPKPTATSIQKLGESRGAARDSLTAKLSGRNCEHTICEMPSKSSSVALSPASSTLKPERDYYQATLTKQTRSIKREAPREGGMLEFGREGGRTAAESSLEREQRRYFDKQTRKNDLSMGAMNRGQKTPAMDHHACVTPRTATVSPNVTKSSRCDVLNAPSASRSRLPSLDQKEWPIPGDHRRVNSMSNGDWNGVRTQLCETDSRLGSLSMIGPQARTSNVAWSTFETPSVAIDRNTHMAYESGSNTVLTPGAAGGKSVYSDEHTNEFSRRTLRYYKAASGSLVTKGVVAADHYQNPPVSSWHARTSTHRQARRDKDEAHEKPTQSSYSRSAAKGGGNCGLDVQSAPSVVRRPNLATLALQYDSTTPHQPEDTVEPASGFRACPLTPAPVGTTSSKSCRWGHERLSRETIFAGKGWISPHPLSVASENNAAPQSTIHYCEDGNARQMTFEEWKCAREGPRDLSEPETISVQP